MSEPIADKSLSQWKHLYSISGVTTIILMAFFLFDTACWIILRPYPSSAEGWFALLQQRRIVGLLLLSFPTFFGTILYFLTFLSFFNLLKQVNIAFASFALLLASAGLSILLVTHMGYPMINLAGKYAAATTETQKALFLAAGEVRIEATVTGTMIGGFLAEGAALIFSLLMLRSNVFGKVTGYLGVIGHGLDFTRLLMSLVLLPEKYGVMLLVIGGLPQLIWLVLVGMKFIQLGRKQTITVNG
jgi:hypothetical protein